MTGSNLQSLLQFATIVVIVAAVTVLAMGDKVNGAAALATIATLGGLHGAQLVGNLAYARGMGAARPTAAKPPDPEA